MCFMANIWDILCLSSQYDISVVGVGNITNSAYGTTIMGSGCSTIVQVVGVTLYTWCGCGSIFQVSIGLICVMQSSV